jgi:Tol biopolymer transport system component
MSPLAGRVRLRRSAVVAVTLAVALAGVLATFAASALATSLPQRTFDLAALAPPLSGGSPQGSDPSVSATGPVIAFDAPFGTDQEIYAVDVVTGTRILISRTGTGVAADGNSTDPSASGTGTAIAFTSTADDLGAAGPDPYANTDQYPNIYVALPNGQIQLVTGAPGGGEANGPSAQPVMSQNGEYVAFVSYARNLVSGDTSPYSQVFVRNLATGRTTLVSAGRGGVPGNNWSSGPSLSANGRYVSFDSAATNLGSRPHRGVSGVYVRDTTRRRTTMVSVTTGGVPQNRAVSAPFRQVSSLSANGKEVVFDSNANNLVRNDVNGSTDVFLHNMATRRTTLISENSTGYEGNSASFDPSLSADGTKVIFESLATNLAGGGGAGENIYERDLSLGTTSVVDVGPSGQAPAYAPYARSATLLQRPALSSNGDIAVFESTATNLADGPTSEPHLIIRLLAPPQASFTAGPPARTHARRVTVSVDADDPAANRFLCQVNHATPFGCRPGKITFKNLPVGRDTLSIRAGGPGMLLQPRALTATVRVSG